MMRTILAFTFVGFVGCSAPSAPIGGGDASTPLFVADLFVATNGNDAWSGKLAEPSPDGTDGPLATLGAAQIGARALVAGRTSPIVVAIRGGTYPLAQPLTLGAGDSGTASAPIVYEAFPGETPIVSGGIALSGFTKDASGVWTASAPGLADVTQLFVNGERRYRIRTTESGYLKNAGQFTFVSATKPTNPPCAKYALVKNSTTTYACYDRFYFKPGDLDPSWSGLGDPTAPIEILGFENWTISRMRLASIDAKAGIAYLTGSAIPNELFGFPNGHRYLVENVREMLASPSAHAGRFFHDPSAQKLSVVAKDPNEDLSNETVIAGRLAQLVVGSGVSHVTFRGITFSHTTWDAPLAGYAFDNGGDYGIPGALAFTGGSDIVLDGCTIDHVAGFGVDLAGAISDVRIVGSTFTDLGAGGIRVGAEPQSSDTDATVPGHVTISDDLIQSGDRTTAASAIWIGNAHDVTIDHDEIADFYNIGVGIGHSLDWVPTVTHDDVVTNTSIHDLGQGVTSDMGAVHTASSLAHGNMIVHNLFHDIAEDPDPAIGYGGDGIYLDQGSENYDVRDNVVWNVTGAALHYNISGSGTYFDPSSGPNRITNNVFALSGQSVHIGFGSDGAHDLDFAHNVFYWDSLAARTGIRSPQAGFFECNVPAAPKSCASYFSFDHDVWFDASDPSATNWKFFVGIGQGSASNYTLLDAAGWQAHGEDADGTSIIADPLFANAAAGDFNVAQDSPALAMGFVPIDTTGIGLVTPRSIAAVAPAFPVARPASF